MNWQQFWDKQGEDKVAALQVARVLNGQAIDPSLVEKIATKISLQLELKNHETLLDVCCGNGQLSKLLLLHCTSVYGVDFSEQLILHARKLHEPNLQFYCASADRFGLNQEFDKVVLYFSFQYFESYEMGKDVIKNLLKHARPGALLLIGDIPDKRKFFTYYNSPKKLLSYYKQVFKGTNNMGKFWHPNELHMICQELEVIGAPMEQEAWQPYSHYRFDYLIKKP
ncbi:MAG: hypothetical protein CFE21_11375 [Bacteroidetes bacterium B1(2017)]|nr:MAG: hypothetical protein CFE21_11375 [Bacteroidetes bacterium B1(2017)]